MSIQDCEGKECLTTRLRGMVCGAPRNGGSWESRAEVATRIGGMDFGCDFDDCGKCVAQRNKTETSSRACCGLCAKTIGWLDELPEGAVTPLVELYNPKVGFWTPRGCSIPPKWRADICFTWVCKEIGTETAETAKTMLQNLPILGVV